MTLRLIQNIKNIEVYRVEKDNKVLGSVDLIQISPTSTKVEFIYINPSNRNKGHATEVLDSLKKKHKHLNLLCEDSLVHFYEKRDFKLVSSTFNGNMMEYTTNGK